MQVRRVAHAVPISTAGIKALRTLRVAKRAHQAAKKRAAAAAKTVRIAKLGVQEARRDINVAYRDIKLAKKGTPAHQRMVRKALQKHRRAQTNAAAARKDLKTARRVVKAHRKRVRSARSLVVDENKRVKKAVKGHATAVRQARKTLQTRRRVIAKELKRAKSAARQAKRGSRKAQAVLKKARAVFRKVQGTVFKAKAALLTRKVAQRAAVVRKIGKARQATQRAAQQVKLQVRGAQKAARSLHAAILANPLPFTTYKHHHLGCHADRKQRDLRKHLGSNDDMTVAGCHALAQKAKVVYYGVQFGRHCWGDNRFGTYGTSNQCTRKCSNTAKFSCGGVWANDVFFVGTSDEKVAGQVRAANRVIKQAGAKVTALRRQAATLKFQLRQAHQRAAQWRVRVARHRVRGALRTARQAALRVHRARAAVKQVTKRMHRVAVRAKAVVKRIFLLARASGVKMVKAPHVKRAQTASALAYAKRVVNKQAPVRVGSTKYRASHQVSGSHGRYAAFGGRVSRKRFSLSFRAKGMFYSEDVQRCVIVFIIIYYYLLLLLLFIIYYYYCYYYLFLILLLL